MTTTAIITTIIIGATILLPLTGLALYFAHKEDKQTQQMRESIERLIKRMDEKNNNNEEGN